MPLWCGGRRRGWPMWRPPGAILCCCPTPGCVALRAPHPGLCMVRPFGPNLADLAEPLWCGGRRRGWPMWRPPGAILCCCPTPGCVALRAPHPGLCMVRPFGPNLADLAEPLWCGGRRRGWPMWRPPGAILCCCPTPGCVALRAPHPGLCMVRPFGPNLADLAEPLWCGPSGRTWPIWLSHFGAALWTELGRSG
ncbi:hypothetical protein J3R75_003185 [Oligosphaera ethanolica]|uniref:Uncharacterized protein n=1 Tax=Oligosphaera ethanolica TaxID=760260 RepID=A0AAE3VIK1_9BACT|nr:hypothetical protein [Oligosphaera ethanolica]